MVTNYPPGVTGNEPEIAGYPTSERFRECQADVPTFTRFSVYEVITSVNLSDPTLARGRLLADINALPTDEEGVCAFEGLVEVEHIGNVEFWTCPNCGMEHESELDE